MLFPLGVRELRRESEGGDKLRAKESCHVGDMRQVGARTIEGDDLKRECSIGPCRFVSSIHCKGRLTVGVRWG